MLAILDIPVSLYTMKEFFDVKLHIINNAPEEVSLTDNRIQLNLPKGVSVVKGGEGSAQSTLAEIPEIKGRSTETVRWILRGDEQGDYSLSAPREPCLRSGSIRQEA